ncbi:hypothetical protein RM780_21675 [Streptomyces sp. DSM 44917]|uniref:Uncharacterized protein n=1 Tax=Streptomyces boetiae TaxID=3075541 RepID=A0ABU2LE38_9ACTN|nr:hypothetical protein [Streptomyces sp. DSM 44917]MDT0309547.1 hypothetical protein [Streptomyces sp. DSM 44917]
MDAQHAPAVAGPCLHLQLVTTPAGQECGECRVLVYPADAIAGGPPPGAPGGEAAPGGG